METRNLPSMSGIPTSPGPAKEVSDAFKKVDRSIDILKRTIARSLIDQEAIDYEAHNRMLQRLVGYLLQGGTTGTSANEIETLGNMMVDAALGIGETDE